MEGPAAELKMTPQLSTFAASQQPDSTICFEQNAMNDGRGSVAAGMAICWLLNVAQLGIGWLLLVADVRMLPAYYVLIGAIGVVQVGYVVPIWRLLRRKGKPRTGKGVLLAAGLTALMNIVIVLVIYTSPRFGIV
jgi:hypothetical protein